MKHTSLLTAIFLVAVMFNSCRKQLDVAPEAVETGQDQQDTSELTDTIHTDLVDATSTTNSVTLASTSDFGLGINGHPLNSDAYLSIGVNSQISLLKSMKVAYYRFDIVINSDGSIRQEPEALALINAAKAANIELLPTVSASTINYSATATAAYAAGKALTQKFSSKYGKYFTYYALGNELDNRAILANRSGQLSTDYDAKKITVISNYIKGMDVGLKASDPTAKTMVDESFLHYGFLQLMQKNGVNFDIVACHWYSDMEGVAAGSQYKIPDITKKLSSLFTKPIWFTEVNKRYRTNISATTWDTDQWTFLNKFIAKCKANKQVKALIIYELLDEPFRPILEAHYGIVKWTVPYTKSRMSLTVKQLQAAALK